MLAVEVEVDESEVGAEPVMVLGDASVAHLVEAEDALQDTEDVSTFARTFDFVVFFFFATSST